MFKNFDISILLDKSMTKEEFIIIPPQFYSKKRKKQYGVLEIRIELIQFFYDIYMNKFKVQNQQIANKLIILTKPIYEYVSKIIKDIDLETYGSKSFLKTQDFKNIKVTIV